MVYPMGALRKNLKRLQRKLIRLDYIIVKERDFLIPQLKFWNNYESFIFDNMDTIWFKKP